MKWVGVLFRMPEAWRRLLNLAAKDSDESLADFIRKRLFDHPDVVRVWIKMGRPVMPPFTVGKSKPKRRRSGQPANFGSIDQRSATDALWGKPDDDA